MTKDNRIKRIARAWPLTALFLLLCAAQTATAEPFETVINNGAPGNRVDVAVLGDGYTAGEMQKYRNDVTAFLQKLFLQEPLKEYQRFFNVHRIDVTSNQSGADHPERNPPLSVDTALGAAYNCSAIQRLICVNNSQVSTIAANTLAPSQRDLVLVLVNDSEYGGSGGAIAVASIHPEVVELILHEMGHSFGLLVDEYGGPPPPSCVNNVEPTAANATKATQRSLIKWNLWIDPGTPIPTSSTTLGVPGLYEGARYCDTGLYRPTYSSKMRSLGRPFEQINTEQLIRRIYNLVAPVDSSQPAASDLTITRGQSQAFSVTPLVTQSNTIGVTWLVNGQAQATGADFTLNSTSLSPGVYSIEAIIKDNTPMVRRDDEGLLVENRRWSVTVNNAAPTTPTVQFTQAAYSLAEGVAQLSVMVTRSGDASAPSTVKYATSDTTDANFRCDPATAGQATGVASRKCDYHISVGTLRFAAGETTKQLTLSAVNDAYAEGNETFTLTLSNATGATLGQNSIAVITITDDDAPGAANPIDNTHFFVRQLYVDLLSREPDPAGWDGWTNRINLCGQPGQPPPPCDRVTVAGDGFLRSGEFFDRQFFVLRLYRTGLGRILRYDEVADLAYVSGFLTAEQLELNKQELVAELMSRTEFAGRYNPLPNATFVDTLLQTAGVGVPQAVRDAWVAALDNSSRTRAQVFREISERPEVSSRYLHEAQVVSCYYGFFTRNPDGAYLSFLTRLDAGEITLADLANAFVNAAEYRQRFGP
jgi:IgA Peptidase M64/Calx-beta domain